MNGIVEKIDGKNITINGKTKTYNIKNFTFKVGDFVEYVEHKRKDKNQFTSIKFAQKVEKKVEKIEEDKSTNSITKIKSLDSNKIKNKKIDSQNIDILEKKEVFLPCVNFKEKIRLGKLDKETNRLFDKYIKNISLGKITNSQLSTLEDEAIKHEFDFNKLGEFIQSKIEKKRNVEFYESFKNDFLGKIEDKNDKDENKKLFYLLKKYYRYLNAKKSLIDLQNNEGDR